ncbi:MAG: hypothetical protein HQL31_03550, partial [Planctomycetes bacterium]|nr:hypothetical protein [Planctomycetota bacterium]
MLQNIKRAEFTAVLSLLLTFAGAVILLLLPPWRGLHALLTYSLFAIVWWAVSWCHLRLVRAEDEERLAENPTQSLRHSESIFDETQDSAYRFAHSRLKAFENYGIRIFAFCAGIGLLFSCFWIRAYLSDDFAATSPEKPLFTAAILAGLAIAAFAMGQYSAGLSRMEGSRQLRPAGDFQIGLALLCSFAVLSLLFSYYGHTGAAAYFLAALPFSAGLIGAELLLNLLLDHFRPRAPGQPWRPPHDSRLLGLSSEPERALRTFAETIDYQFGFKVSETWFFRFLSRRIVPLLLFQCLCLYLLSCVVVIRPGEQAVCERFGRSLPGELASGIHFKFPYPIDRIVRVNSDRVREVVLGRPGSDRSANPSRFPAYVWT